MKGWGRGAGDQIDHPQEKLPSKSPALLGLRSNGPQKLCTPKISPVIFGKGSIQHFAPVIWNSIPGEIRIANTLSSFKKKKFENGSYQIVTDDFV